jgi:ubiquinone/menaquinone biosynthesis C-methylase UbiE
MSLPQAFTFWGPSVKQAEQIERLRLERQRMASWGSLNLYRLDAVRQYAGSSILDVGCSSGAYVRYLTQLGYSVYGADLLSVEEWRTGSAVQCCVADASWLPFKANAFDTVLAFEVLEHIYDVDRAIAELYRVARKNIIVSVPDCTPNPVLRDAGLAFHHWVDRTHVQTFTRESLAKRLSSHGFRVKVTRSINPVRPELVVLSTWHIPPRLARAFSQILHRLPFVTKIYMTLLAVAFKT